MPSPKKFQQKSYDSDRENAPLLDFDENSTLTDVPLPSVQFRRGGNFFASSSEPSTTRSGDGSPTVSFEMRARARRPDVLPTLNPSFVFVDVPIEPEDTLPSFAIKYHVTTAELKKINGLFHDQDFYGRQKLKVPIHKYGILAEKFLPSLVKDMDDAGPSSPASVLVDLSGSPDPSLSGPLRDNGEESEVMSGVATQNISVRSMLNSQSREAKLFLQNMDRDLSRLTREAMSRVPRSPVGETELLTNRNRVEPLDGLGCDGADFGIPLKGLLCMLIILAVILPGAFLFFQIYCASHPGSCPDTHPPHSGNFSDH